MIEDDQVPVFFSIFPVLVNVENLNFLIEVVVTVAPKALFKFLDVSVIQVVVIVVFFFVIGEC